MQERAGGKDHKGTKGNLKDDEYVHRLDYSKGFMDMYIFQNYQIVLNMYNLFCVN